MIELADEREVKEPESLTVESALRELRKTFPDQVCEISFRTAGLGLVKVVAWGNNVIPKHRVSKYADTLAECMAQVREWKHSQDNKESK